jgi:hypothetical protein
MAAIRGTSLISDVKSGHDISGDRVVKSGGKSDSVCIEQSEHQIFRKEAGIPDVPGG